VFLGPPGTGKTHLAIGLAIRACQAGHRVLSATAAEWVARLAEAHHNGRLQAELTKLARVPLLVVDLCRAPCYAERGGEGAGQRGLRWLATRHNSGCSGRLVGAVSLELSARGWSSDHGLLCASEVEGAGRSGVAGRDAWWPVIGGSCSDGAV
jgi:IstB-like ATP binding protein